MPYNFSAASAAIATPYHIQEAQQFQDGLNTLYETMKRGLEDDEEIAVFYETSKETVRVDRIKMACNSVLILAGEDMEGNRTAVAGHFKSMNLIYKKVKLGDKKQRTPIGFDTVTG